MTILGGIEFGGTKTVCVVGRRGHVDRELRLPTGSDPMVTVNRCVEFFRTAGPVTAVGVGTFGPCNPTAGSATYGFVTTTPKPGWQNFDLLGSLRRALPEVAMGFDTDVNVAALGEMAHGAGRGLTTLVYLTIGTGVGGGVIAEGRLLHGLVHPEVGHIRVPRPVEEAERFDGVCPFHGDCVEGLCSGPALAARWGDPAQDIGPDDPRHDPMWDLEAEYVASLLHSLVCTLSPQRIILGGGVGAQAALHDRIGARLQRSLAGYIDHRAILAELDQYVVTPRLGNQSGGIGAIELAARTVAVATPTS